MSALAQLISDHMAAEGLTIEQVARRSGMSVSSVGAYKIGTRGSVNPKRETLRRLAVGLGLRPEVLLRAAGLTDKAGDPDKASEQLLLSLWRELPTSADRRQALETLRSHVRAVRARNGKP